MEVCYNCSSTDLWTMEDGVTCGACSRSQECQIYGEQLFKSNRKPIKVVSSFSLIYEIEDRFGLSFEDSDKIRKRAEVISKMKSNFLTQHIIIALYFLSRKENNCYISSDTFCKLFGKTIDSNQLLMTVVYIEKVLNIESTPSITQWDCLINSYSSHFKLGDRKSISNITKNCNTAYDNSTISVYGVTAITMLHWLLEQKNDTFEEAVNKISAISNITYLSLLKNYDSVFISPIARTNN